MNAFINEFHYDNIGGDLGEFIEIAAPAGFDLNGWTIVLYNGSNGASYNTIDLSGLTVTDSGAGFGFISVEASGLLNGSPDAMALVDDNGAVVEFLVQGPRIDIDLHLLSSIVGEHRHQIRLGLILEDVVDLEGKILTFVDLHLQSIRSRNLVVDGIRIRTTDLVIVDND